MSELPSWDGFLVSVLRAQQGGEVRPIRSVRELAAADAALTSYQRAELLSSGQPVYENRIGWAISYLTRVGALTRPVRAHYSITELGRDLLAKNPTSLTESDLRRLAKPGDEWWLNRGLKNNVADAVAPVTSGLDPIEQIAEGVNRIHDSVSSELLTRVLEQGPAFFERAVVRLLIAMGYGGTGGMASTTQLVNDGGIDGVIDQDVLGLTKVYVQAKRYAPDRAVQRPEVQAFVGALSGKAEQGVFITTGRYSTGALEYAERDARVRIILIDGKRLTDLMIRFGVGVQTKETVKIVEVDEDFFE